MIRIAAGLVLGTMVITGGQLGIWLAERDPPTVVLHTEVVPIKPWPDGEVQIRYNVRRYKQCATRVERSVYDSKQLRMVLPPREFAIAPGPIGDDTYSVSVMLPESMSPGRATYRINTTYVCNPIHRIWPIVVIAPDIAFDVQPSPERQSSIR